jgi:hypothetical protein
VFVRIPSSSARESSTGRRGYTIAVSEAKSIVRIAGRTVISDTALSALVPILEDIVGWKPPRIRRLFESYGLVLQEWDKARTDWLTVCEHSVAVAAPVRRPESSD